MATKGRPRLTEDVIRQRIADYCARYGAGLGPSGFPVFPAGRRETRQHREWLVLYKALSRLRRQQELGPAHGATGNASAEEAAFDRAGLLKAQKGRCPICGDKVVPEEAVEDRPRPEATPALVHPSCKELATLARRLGEAGLDSLRRYLWPGPGDPEA